MNNGRRAESSHGSQEEKKSRAGVRLLQLLFLLISFWQLDQPLLTAHYERQNQTFDIARHVFREGWRAVITPTVAFTVAGHEDQRSIAVLQEMPLHGILGWPFVKLLGHPYAVTRLVSVFFSLWSIALLFDILRYWVKPAIALTGAAIWTFSPLLLQFGQVPMPDIICTAGILAAFLYAQRGNLMTASAAFLFAILAKSNSIVFGLPVLVALAVARNCRSPKEFIRVALLWGWAPLIGLAGWMVLMKWFAPDAVWSTFHTLSDGRGKWTALVRMPYYLNVFGCMLPFGFGVLGTVGLVFCRFKKSESMNAAVKWAFYISSLVYLVFVIRKLLEPQYFLPLLAWALIAASIGWQWAVENYQRRPFWKWGLAGAGILHVIIALIFTADVKASRVPNYPDILAASHLLKRSDRVLIFYRSSTARRQPFGLIARCWLFLTWKT